MIIDQHRLVLMIKNTQASWRGFTCNRKWK